jgi:hypothetical protein
VVALAAGGALVAGGGVTLGQGGGGTTAFRACVDKRGGELFIPRAGRSCRRSQRVVTWNVRGPAGPAGVAGPPGERGADGTTGPTGPKGADGTFEFDSFDGMPCDDGSGPGTVDMTYDSNGFARFQC